MTDIEALYVGWQDQESRRWFVVGRLARVSDGGGHGGPEFEFAYVEGVHEARENGFRPFVAFPDLEQAVRSRDLLPFFRNRLMPKSRPDYGLYLEQLALDSAAGEFAILARSGGLRTTEHGEIELFAPPQRRADGAYEAYFLVRGIRHVDPKHEVVAALRERDRLFCVLDVQNPKNPEAVLLRTAGSIADGLGLVGYVPDYLCHDVSILLRRHCDVRVIIARINDSPRVPVQNRLVCRLEASMPADLRPFSDPKFAPIDREAAALAA